MPPASQARSPASKANKATFDAASSQRENREEMASLLNASSGLQPAELLNLDELPIHPAGLDKRDALSPCNLCQERGS